jgi:glycosyltransferase involved in cell wall biosynthesis
VNCAIVHDYITQRGGAERVLLEMAHALPGVPIYTSFYNPSTTYPEFAQLDIRVGALNRFPFLRRDPRRAVPFLSSYFSQLDLTQYDKVLCSSSGWAHLVRGSRVVYCYNPPRRLYQTESYFGTAAPGVTARKALTPVLRALRRRDQSSVVENTPYIAISSVVSARIKRIYGLDAQVIHPPVTFDGSEAQTPIEFLGIPRPFFVTVARGRGYKNHAAVVAAFREMPNLGLVIVGGPTDNLPANACALSNLSDTQLSWLYAESAALISASDEDFGLTPIEANVYGTPALLLRAGGFLDTLIEGVNGLHFDDSEIESIIRVVQASLSFQWVPEDIRSSALSRFSPAAFGRQIRASLGVDS